MTADSASLAEVPPAGVQSETHPTEEVNGSGVPSESDPVESTQRVDLPDRSPADPPKPDASSERSPRAMPDFILKDLDGKTVRLSDYAGRAVLINFWATWCAPCKAELPELVEIQREFGSDGFTILGISLDQVGPAAVRRFAQTFGLNYRILMGNPTVVAQYGNFRGIPASFLLNERHEQVRRYIGLITRAQLTRDLENLLASQA
jgi:peroxiredoxin